MIKVGLCDDITDYNKKMENYIIRYGNENHLKVKITAYGSGSQLLLNFQKRKFDIIFLDVSMPELDGFETAERIRSIDENVVIVFCTSFYTISNAGKGFEVDAEDFLSKPLLYKKVEYLLNKVYKKKLLCAEEKLFLKCQDGLITLQLSDIIYIQVRNKLLILHTNKGEIQSSQRMRELEERLSRKLFFRCHNSYIVNLEYLGSNGKGLTNCNVDFGIVRGSTQACSAYSGNCLSESIVGEVLSKLWSKAEMEGFTLYTKPFHRWIYCGLYADSQFTVTPNGELYKCWEHAGDEQHLMGNINENGNIDNIKYSYYDWMSHNPLENEECKECVYLPACGGGCGVVSYNETNSYHSKGCFKVKGVLEKQVLRYFKGKI